MKASHRRTFLLVPVSLALLLAVIFMTAMPQGRALAQQFLSLFFQTAPDVRPLDPTAGPVVITPAADIQEAEDLTKWKVFKPSWLPEGFEFHDINYHQEREFVVQTYVYKKTIGMQAAYFYLMQRKAPFTELWPIGESAQVETVQIGDVIGEYVIGAWGGTEDHQEWENNPAIQHLRWQANGYYFDLQFNIMGVAVEDMPDHPYYLSKDQLIAIANSIK